MNVGPPAGRDAVSVLSHFGLVGFPCPIAVEAVGTGPSLNAESGVEGMVSETYAAHGDPFPPIKHSPLLGSDLCFLGHTTHLVNLSIVYIYFTLSIIRPDSKSCFEHSGATKPPEG